MKEMIIYIMHPGLAGVPLEIRGAATLKAVVDGKTLVDFDAREAGVPPNPAPAPAPKSLVVMYFSADELKDAVDKVAVPFVVTCDGAPVLGSGMQTPPIAYGSAPTGTIICLTPNHEYFQQLGTAVDHDTVKKIAAAAPLVQAAVATTATPDEVYAATHAWETARTTLSPAVQNTIDALVGGGHTGTRERIESNSIAYYKEFGRQQPGGEINRQSARLSDADVASIVAYPDSDLQLLKNGLAPTTPVPRAIYK